MEMMSIRMRFPSDIQNHAYLWTDPKYETELGRKFQRKLKMAAQEKAQILEDVSKRMQNIAISEPWTADLVNKTCSEYLSERPTLSNEDVFYLIRFALTGNPVGAPIGEISEVIGRL